MRRLIRRGESRGRRQGEQPKRRSSPDELVLVHTSKTGGRKKEKKRKKIEKEVGGGGTDENEDRYCQRYATAAMRTAGCPHEHQGAPGS